MHIYVYTYTYIYVYTYNGAFIVIGNVPMMLVLSIPNVVARGGSGEEGSGLGFGVGRFGVRGSGWGVRGRRDRRFGFQGLPSRTPAHTTATTNIVPGNQQITKASNAQCTFLLFLL